MKFQYFHVAGTVYPGRICYFCVEIFQDGLAAFSTALKGEVFMSIINELACKKEIKSDVPNQELARKLVEENNTEGIKDVVDNLWNKDKKIQSDCIKVLYEVGYLKPELISEYVFDFLKLLKSKHNRLVWGGMIALSTISSIKAQVIYDNLDSIYSAIKDGSVITIDNGIKTLAKVAAENHPYNKEIFPYLINHLKTCRPKDLPQHSESVFVCVKDENKQEYLSVLKEREDNMTPSQLKRINKIYKALDSR